jgi:hypothetical protein
MRREDALRKALQLARSPRKAAVPDARRCYRVWSTCRQSERPQAWSVQEGRDRKAKRVASVGSAIAKAAARHHIDAGTSRLRRLERRRPGIFAQKAVRLFDWVSEAPPSETSSLPAESPELASAFVDRFAEFRALRTAAGIASLQRQQSFVCCTARNEMHRPQSRRRAPPATTSRHLALTRRTLATSSEGKACVSL